MNGREEKIMLRAALLRIGCYVAAMSLYESLGAARFGEPGRFAVSAALLLLLLLTRRGERFSEASLLALPYGKLLYLIPLAAIATANLWNGAAARFSAGDTAFCVASMLTIGVLEETLFRGYLLRALQRRSVKTAVLVTGLTFGLGHIVNLLSGAELFSTLLQLIYAFAIGTMLSVFMARVRSLVPCCVFHGVFNALAAFSREEGQTAEYQLAVCAVLTAASLLYALYLWRLDDARKET